MGSKARPGNEYLSRHAELTSPPPRKSKTQTGRPHPELRIVQDAVTDIGMGNGLSGDEHAADWVDFLNKIGRKYKGKGIARSLGSVSITLVSASEISKMMDHQYGAQFQRREEARRLLRRVATKTRAFLYEKHVDAGDQKARQLYETLLPDPDDEYQIGDWAFAFGNETESAEEAGTQFGNEGLSCLTAPGLSIEQRLENETELRRHLFGEAVYYVPQIDAVQPYSHDALGIDLSSNEQIMEQRDALKTFFRRDMGFNVGLMDPNAKPHAVIFNLFSHISTADFEIDYKGMPCAMTFEPIRLDSSGDDDILFE